MESALQEAIARCTRREDLSPELVTAAFAEILNGDANDVRIAAFGVALRAKGETVEELVAAVRVLRSMAVELRTALPVVDTCGTGGDGLGTFNVSTTASFVAAAGGAPVAKHGGRAASGKVGAADVLEALGATIELSPEAALRCLERCGVTFLFAQAYHPAMRNVAAVRRELGFRTLFNLVGPLCNPAGARRQVLGVWDERWMEPMAEALRRLGSEHVLVVHGDDGSDEITPAAPTSVVELRGGEVTRYRVEPSDFAMTTCAPGDLAGGDAATSAAMVREVLGGAAGPRSDAAALNAGAALYVAGRAATLREGVDAARAILAGGKALATLDCFVAATRKQGCEQG